jgi:hypothetical protein
MKVERVPLPGAATVVVIKPSRRVLIDSGLSRDEAMLAITGVMPGVHPDVVDHWLDTSFDRRRLPFTARQLISVLAVAAAIATALPHSAHDVIRARRPVANVHVSGDLPDRVLV